MARTTGRRTRAGRTLSITTTSSAVRGKVAVGVLGGLVLAVSATVMVWAYLRHYAAVDLRTYREGILAFVHGEDVYQVGFDSGHFPFTYPTPSLVIFLPLAAISLAVARMALWVASAAALVGVVNLALARTGLVTDRWYRWATVLAVSGAALWLEPVRSTLSFGQINLLLLGMVAVDCLAVRTRLPRGALIGLATAIKLTPGIFVVYLLLTGQRRAAFTAAGVFAGAVAVGFAVSPALSWEFWTNTVFDARRVGRPSFVGNQSLRGVLARLYETTNPPSLIGFALALPVGVAGLYLAVRAHQRGDIPLGFGLAGLTGLLVSPISWNHHWVYAVPLIIALVARAAYAAAPYWLALAGGLTALFYVAPMWWVPHGGGLSYQPDGFVDVLLADSYIIAGVLVLALVPVLARTASVRGFRPCRSTPTCTSTPSTPARVARTPTSNT